MRSQVISLESKRLAGLQRSGAFQHFWTGVLLLEAGFDQLRLHPGEDVGLGWFTLIAGAVLVVAVIRELRHLRKHRKHLIRAAGGHGHAVAAPAGGIDWMDVVAVPALIAEGWHKAHRGAHYLPYVYFGLAAFMLLRGVLLGRFIGKPHLAIDEHRLLMRTSPFRSRTIEWANVVGLTRTAKGLAFQLVGGTLASFKLTDFVNRPVVEEAMVTAWDAIAAARIPAAPPTPAIAAAPAETSATVSAAPAAAPAAAVSASSALPINDTIAIQ